MPARPDRGHHSRGQSLVEFALIVPVFVLFLAGIIQFGLLFWAQNTLTQVVRDTGRWAASQKECSPGQVRATARDIAAGSSLLGYETGAWTDAAIVVSYDFSGATCIPTSNVATSWVDITITHEVPIFFPWIPGEGKLTSTARFRMEPCAGIGC